MQVEELLTLGGAAVIVTIVTEVIKRATAMSEAQVTRFGPLLSIALGIGVACAAAFASSTFDYASAILTGLLAGASASGIYSYSKAVRA
jgi:hypothetical protein